MLARVSRTIARRPAWAAGSAVALVAALVHVRSVGFGFTYLDDRDFIVDDHALFARPVSLLRVFARSYMHVVDAQHPYYRPLVTLSYALDAQWSGFDAFGYHLTNVVLHAAASVLVYALLCCTLAPKSAGAHRSLPPRPSPLAAQGPPATPALIALLAALVFAVHPALACSVAWLPGRNDVLLALFVLASWLLFLREVNRPSWTSRLFHLVFFWLALLTKETAFVVPVVCLAHLALVEPDAWARWVRSRAVLLMSAGWLAGLAARWFIHRPSGVATPEEGIHNLPLLAASLGRLALPANPSLIAVAEDLPIWPGVLAASLVLACAWRVPNVRRRVLALGSAAFVAFVAPALAVPGSLVLGTRLYLPACGFIIVLGEIMRALARDRATSAAFAGAAMVALSGVTVGHEGAFRDRRSFARSAVLASPHSPLAHFCLGQTHQIDGDTDAALTEYQAALSLGAVYGVHNNIAVLQMRSARWPEAERELREELAVDPGYALAYRNLGVVLRHQGRLDEAQRVEDRARELASEDASR